MLLFASQSEDGKTAAWPLLTRALKEHRGLPALPPVARSARGKPWFPTVPELCFNLSHSGPYSLCALGDTPVGVDIEVLRPRRESLPSFVFSTTEYRWYQDRGSRWGDFYTLWTLKESKCKSTGGGLNCPARTIAVPLLEPGQAAALEGLWFSSFGGDDWRASVCAAEPVAAPEWL